MPRRELALDLLPWGAVLLACLPLLVGGFPAGHDWTFELTRDWAYGRALAAGQVPPHWASELYWGCGSPVFLFYPPLFALQAAALSAAAGSVTWGATAALVLFTVLGMVTVTRAVRAAPGGTRPGARVAAYLLVLGPYLLGDALIRNACAEYAALCLMPLAVEGLLVADTRPRSGAFLLAAGVALVMLAHNLMGLVLVVGLAAAAVGLGPLSGRRLSALAGGTGLGLVISSFYWLPALLLTPWVRPGDLLGGKLDFHDNFRPLTDLLGYEPFFAVGLLPVVVWAGAAYTAARYRGALRVLVYCLVAAAMLLVLQLRVAVSVWELVPTLAYFQFPWRLMGPLSVITALCGGFVFAWASRGWPSRAVRAAEVAVLVLCVANALPRLSQYGPLEPEQVAAFEATLEPAAPAEHRVTLADEFLPRGADRDACASGAMEDAGFAFPGLEVIDGESRRRAPLSRRICTWVSLVGLLSLLGLGLAPRLRRRQSS